MSHLSQRVENALHNAVLVARNSGQAEVGLLHMLCGILEAEPELAPDLTTAQVRKRFPRSSGELRFAPELLSALKVAQWRTSELAEPEEVHCLQALLQPGRALLLLAHHLGVDPDHWRLRSSRDASSGPGLELLPDLNEWRMLLTWLENPVSQLRSWLNEEQLSSATVWVERIVAPYPQGTDTGWLALARQCAARDAQRQPLSARGLYHVLLQQREVALLHWEVGGNWILPVGLHSFWHSPGLVVARHYGHPEVTDLHVLLDCLNEPGLQADLNPLRQAVRRVLEAGPGHSSTVATALRRTLKYCRRWRVEPARLHLAYVLLREFAAFGIAEALEWSGRDARAWLRRLRRFITGRLRPGDWSVDGFRLGQAASEVGPVRAVEEGWETLSGTRLWLDQEGEVNQIQGTTLLCEGSQLLGPATRHYSAEAQVGTGRLERWLPYLQLELKVHCEAGYVAQVGLRKCV